MDDDDTRNFESEVNMSKTDDADDSINEEFPPLAYGDVKKQTKALLFKNNAYFYSFKYTSLLDKFSPHSLFLLST